MTRRQHQLLLLLHQHIQNTGAAPSVRELAAMQGSKAVGGTHVQLKRLQQDGWIRMPPGRVRAIEVLRLPDGGVLRGPARADAIERLAAELARHDDHTEAAQREADATFAAWMLTTIEAAGLRLIDMSARPAQP